MRPDIFGPNVSNNNRQVLDPQDSLARHERRSMSYISGTRSRPCASAKSVLERRTCTLAADVRVRRGLRGSRLALPSMLPDCSDAAIAGSANSKARSSVTAWVGSSTGDYAKRAGYILPLAAFLGNLPPSSATAQGLPAPRN
ncbi:hypothetical protein BDN71DRAFT_1511461 [Pleurotus eryngii]|uniref:Uncharacterized protein n=1 Tax=Pleurotus eryngii TaxID=5323 RepID=A0A9P6DBZ0_PLEER|nr:hypothetical protein BDN71DRAFT_1511461 [Pleurotus eryngii]